jgi:hypothetical protein
VHPALAEVSETHHPNELTLTQGLILTRSSAALDRTTVTGLVAVQTAFEEMRDMRTIKKPSLPLRRIAALSLMVGGALATSSAVACEVWRDEFGYRGICDLRVEFKDKYRLNVEFLATLEPRFHFKIPNFHPRKFKYFVTGTDVQIDLEIENLGDLDAPAADVAVMVNIVDPLTGTQQPTMPYTARTPVIAAGMSGRVNITHVQMPNQLQDWDIVSVAVVDPPTTAQPIRGGVAESDETDNVLNHTCRVYGPNPDTSVGPCN